MTREEIKRHDAYLTIERASGPFGFTVEQMEEMEEMNIKRRALEAAAPDMRAALELAETAIEEIVENRQHLDLHEDDREMLDEALAMVRAAIAKAKGGAA